VVDGGGVRHWSGDRLVFVRAAEQRPFLEGWLV
jgi:hypothetical protein